jgi:hypothetical protein
MVNATSQAFPIVMYVCVCESIMDVASKALLNVLYVCMYIRRSLGIRCVCMGQTSKRFLPILSVVDILANLSSKEGRQYEDACDECREVCDTFEAMHPSGPFGKRACHSGPTWITACIELLPPAAASAVPRMEDGVQKPAPRLGKVGEGFAGDALTIPVAGFSFGSDDKQGMYRRVAARLGRCAPLEHHVVNPLANRVAHVPRSVHDVEATRTR